MPAYFGIIGYPLTHSFSPAYFKKKFTELHLDAVYKAFPLATIHELPALLEANPNLEGFNVTIPYKEIVFPFLDEIHTVARQIGAVNCVSIKEGKKKGYNTDVLGFEQSLIPQLTAQHKQALILGTGGSSKAVAYVLKQLGIPSKKISRDKFGGFLTYDELTADIIGQHKLIINTTPLGQYPNVNDAPDIPYQNITAQHLLYDLVYNPEETLFLARGRERGAATKNGFEMLQLQAEASWEIWNGQPTV